MPIKSQDKKFLYHSCFRPIFTQRLYPSRAFNMSSPVVSTLNEKHTVTCPVPVAVALATTQAPETAIAPASMQAPAIAQVASPPKQGAKCCGFCCDYRRAVIIVNIVIIILEFILIITLTTYGVGFYYQGVSSEAWEEHLETCAIVEIICSIVSIALSSAAIAGAVKYNMFLVGANGVWLIVGYIIALISVLNACNTWNVEYPYSYYECQVNGFAILVSLVVAGLWAYPHVGFIHEVRKGIMSENTYSREEYSCCCV
jgi:fumarate reductase subunit C